MNTQNFDPDYHPKVFISYSWDSSEHLNRVLALADCLRKDGVDCEIDQYFHQTQLTEGWYRWMIDRIEEAKFVLLICTENFYLRFRGKENTDVGRGVTWEGAIITQDLYNKKTLNDKYIPVLLTESGKLEYIPEPLRSSSHYEMDRQYEDLYRHLTNQPDTPKPELGKLRQLSPRKRTQYFVEEIQRFKPQIQLELTYNLSIVKGDLVGADKIGGDKVDGDKNTVDNISNSQGVAIGREAISVVRVVNQLRDSSAPDAQRLADLVMQLQSAIEGEDFGLSEEDRIKALKHSNKIAKFGQERQNSDLRDAAETALDALPTILSRGMELNQTTSKNLLSQIKEILEL